MPWSFVLVLLLMVPIIFLPPAFLWYAEPGGVREVFRHVSKGKPDQIERAQAYRRGGGEQISIGRGG